MYATSEELFMVAMDAMKLLNLPAYEYLMDPVTLPRELWTDYAFRMPTWNSHTNNLAEHGIAWLGEEMRKKSVVAFLKEYLSKLMTTRQQRYSMAKLRQSTGHMLTAYAEQIFNQNAEQAKKYDVLSHSDTTFYVKLNGTHEYSSSGTRDDGRLVCWHMALKAMHMQTV